MSTMQPSESINSFFDGYVNSTTPLKIFVNDYGKKLMRMTKNECLVDFNSLTKMIPQIILNEQPYVQMCQTKKYTFEEYLR